MHERTVAAVLRKQVGERPDTLALLGPDGRGLTFAQTYESACRMAGGFSALGVKRQELVLLMLDNHVDHALSWIGLNVGAFVAVPINTALRGDLLAAIVRDSGAAVIVVDAVYADRVSELVGVAPALRTVVVRGEPAEPVSEQFRVVPFEVLLAGEADVPEPPRVSEVSTVLYTSGTEGSSKGVLCSHGHTFSMASGIQYAPEAGEVILIVAPLFHAVGLLTGVYAALSNGATALVQGGFSASKFWQVVRESGAVQTILVGAMADFLWRGPESAEDTNHSLRNITVVPAVPFLLDFGRRFGVRVWSAYGQTETGTTMLTGPDEARPYLCGKPRDIYQVRLVDDNDDDVPRGQPGEIVIRSNEPWAIMLGYHGQPEATARAWRNLWMHTGDCAYQDESGQYIFVDRKRDALRRRGENVSSIEVEKCIVAHDAVESAAIIAVPSDHSEDEIKAYLVLRPGVEFDPEALLHDLARRLPYFMVPRYYEVLDALPLTPSFKVKKGDLRARGVTTETWDCVANGFQVKKSGVVRDVPVPAM